MNSAQISDALIVSLNEDLIQAASDHLRVRGVSHIAVMRDLVEAKEGIKRFPRALLIVDWDLGGRVVAPLLSASHSLIKGPLRTVMLVASQVSEGLVATAAEYSVSQIYTDEKTTKSLGPRLTALLMVESLTDEVKSGLTLAKELRASGAEKKALTVLKELLAKHPQNLRVKAETADLMIHLGDSPQALGILSGIERSKPPYSRGLHLIGRAMMRLGRYDEAIETLGKAQILNPHDPGRLVDIGQAYLKAERISEAEENFDAALSLDPTIRDATIGKSQCRLLEGDINEALEILREISGDVEKASIFNTCAVVNMRKGQADAAMKLYTAALKAIPRAPLVQARIHFNMGLALRRVGHIDEAKEAFEKSLSLDPAFEKARLQIVAITGTLPASGSLGSGAADPKVSPSSKTQEKYAGHGVVENFDTIFAPISPDFDPVDALLEEDLEKS